MLFRLFKFIFKPGINRLLSRKLRPVSRLIPVHYQFPVCGFFKFKIPGHGHIFIEGHYTSYIGRRLFWAGIKGFEYNSVKEFLKLAKQSKTFLDIGANFGYYSLLASKVNPQIQCIAFEPFPDARKALERNIDKNEFSNIQVIPLGLADKKGEEILHFVRSSDFPDELQLAGSNTLADVNDFRKEQITIQTERLDDFVKQENIQNIDLIKIDVETLEYLILSNAREMISTHKPIIQCEVLHGHHEEKLQQLFEEFNYQFYRIEKSGLVLSETLVSENGADYNFLFVPKGKTKFTIPT